MKVSRTIALALFGLVACLSAGWCEPEKPAAAFDPTANYEPRTLAGFTVLVNRKALAHEAATREALDLLEEKLAEVVRILLPDRLKPLRTVRVWVEWDQTDGGAQYHVSADWLQEHGYNPEKAGDMEVSNVAHFVKWTHDAQPMMVLHELAHAYQHKVLGDDYEGIQKAYEQAVKAKRYESVPYVLGGLRRAYALTNSKEYFAELTEAYFGVNDFFPFTRDELREYDPPGYRLMEEVWGKRKDDVALTVANETKKEAQLYWLDGRKLVFYGRIKPGEECKQATFVGHKWEAVFAGEDGQVFTTPGFDTTWRLR
jgi:hypothetical protein